MKAVSNSFHTSGKKHAISNKTDLKKIENHNDRGYSSKVYQHEKVWDLIEEKEGLSADLKSFILENFTDAFNEYNEKQTRNDRKKTGNVFDYFVENKSTQIANETIFQLGDKEFWSDFCKIKTVKRKNKKDLIIKNYDTKIKFLMNDLFLRQAEAYENIYKTHALEIAKKISAAHSEALVFMNKLDLEKRKHFFELAKLKKEKREKEFLKLSEEDQNLFLEYLPQAENFKFIEEKRLLERIANGNFHIKLIGLKAHYDEFSPHAHGVSVCYCDDYKTGMSKRICKSIVLNKFTLEVLQDRMREIAQEFLEENKEIFHAILKEKNEGRNLDYSKEEIIRQNQNKLIEDVNKLKESKQQLLDENNELKNEQKNIDIAVKNLKNKKDNIDMYVEETLNEKEELDAIVTENQLEIERAQEEISRMRAEIREIANVKITPPSLDLCDENNIDYIVSVLKNVPGALDEMIKLAQEKEREYKESIRNKQREKTKKLHNEINKLDGILKDAQNKTKNFKRKTATNLERKEKKEKQF